MELDFDFVPSGDPSAGAGSGSSSSSKKRKSAEEAEDQPQPKKSKLAVHEVVLEERTLCSAGDVKYFKDKMRARCNAGRSSFFSRKALMCVCFQVNAREERLGDDGGVVNKAKEKHQKFLKTQLPPFLAKVNEYVSRYSSAVRQTQAVAFVHKLERNNDIVYDLDAAFAKIAASSDGEKILEFIFFDDEVKGREKFRRIQIINFKAVFDKKGKHTGVLSTYNWKRYDVTKKPIMYNQAQVTFQIRERSLEKDPTTNAFASVPFECVGQPEVLDARKSVVTHLSTQATLKKMMIGEFPLWDPTNLVFDNFGFKLEIDLDRHLLPAIALKQAMTAVTPITVAHIQDIILQYAANNDKYLEREAAKLAERLRREAAAKSASALKCALCRLALDRSDKCERCSPAVCELCVFCCRHRWF